MCRDKQLPAGQSGPAGPCLSGSSCVQHLVRPAAFSYNQLRLGFPQLLLFVPNPFNKLNCSWVSTVTLVVSVLLSHFFLALVRSPSPSEESRDGQTTGRHRWSCSFALRPPTRHGLCPAAGKLTTAHGQGLGRYHPAPKPPTGTKRAEWPVRPCRGPHTAQGTHCAPCGLRTHPFWRAIQ